MSEAVGLRLSIPSRDAAELSREVAGRGEVTLEECFRLALRHGIQLRARAEVAVQLEADRRQAIAALLPQVSAHGHYLRQPEEFRILINRIPKARIEYWLEASQALFDAKAFTAVQVAAATRDIEKLRLADERDRLLYEVASAFYEVVSLEADRAALAARQVRVAEQARVTEVEVKAGQARPEDVFEARAQSDDAEMNGVLLEEQIARARLQLSRLTGLSPLPARVRDTFQVTWTPGELPRLVETARRNRTDLAIATKTERREVLARRQTLAEYLPTAGIEGTYWGRREDFDKDNDWMFRIHIDWTLYDGGGREARRERAESTLRQARLEVERTAHAMEAEVEEALIGFRSLERMAAVLGGRAEAARAALEAAKTALAAGTVTELHHLLAQEAAAAVERDLLRVRAARTLALLRIRLAVGDLRAALEAAG